MSLSRRSLVAGLVAALPGRAAAAAGFGGRRRPGGGISRHGVSLLSGRFWQARHPPRYAAFNQTSSPRFTHSSPFIGTDRDKIMATKRQIPSTRALTAV